MMSIKLSDLFKSLFIFDQSSNQISAEELNILIRNDSDSVFVIDVRSQVEYENEHISQAISIPLTDIEQGSGLHQIQFALKKRKLIVYCTVGKRSQKALHLLKQAGISGFNLRGGIQAWHRLAEFTQAKSC